MLRLPSSNFTRTILIFAITALMVSPSWAQDVFTVNDLSPRTTEKQIRQLFKPYGEVLSIKMRPAKERSGYKKQTARVVMKKSANTKAMVSRLNGSKLNGSDIIVSISREPDRQDFKARNRAGWMTP